MDVHTAAAAALAAIPELLKAAAVGDLERLKRLTSVDHTVTDEDGWTALHYAASAGKTHICKYLIEELKLDVDAKDDKGFTPLILATSALPTASYLVKAGANVNEINRCGRTALHYAAMKDHKKIMQLLIANGADVNVLSRGRTPLHIASYLGKKESVRILLEHKSNPNIITSEWFTPLEYSILGGSFECIELLLKAGADPDADLGFSGFRPLHRAVLERRMDIVKLLLRFGANPDAVDSTGLTPLEFAALVDNSDGMRILHPLTSRLPSVLDWSIQGIVNHVYSKEAMVKLKIKDMEKFVLAKHQGDEAFVKNDYNTALSYYTKALVLFPTDASVRLNRSLCWVNMGEGRFGLWDALKCVMLKPHWSRGLYAVGLALLLLKDYSMAVNALSEALELAPDNAEINKALREAVEAELASSLGDNVWIN